MHLNLNNLATYSIIIGVLGFWGFGSQSWRLGPRVFPPKTTPFHSLSFSPPLQPPVLLALPSAGCAWAGKNSGQPAARPPGWQIRTSPPASLFHPWPERQRVGRSRERLVSFFSLSLSPYLLFLFNMKGGGLGWERQTKWHEKRGKRGGHGREREKS